MQRLLHILCRLRELLGGAQIEEAFGRRGIASPAPGTHHGARRSACALFGVARTQQSTTIGTADEPEQLLRYHERPCAASSTPSSRSARRAQVYAVASSNARRAMRAANSMSSSTR